MVSGEAPQVCPLNAFNRLSLFFALETMSFIWSLKFSFWSSWIPRNVQVLLYFRSSPFRYSRGKFSFFEFEKKNLTPGLVWVKTNSPLRAEIF